MFEHLLKRGSCSLLLIVLMMLPVFASSDALWEMLAQSRNQAQNLSYEGLLVSHSNGFSQSSRLFHQHSEQGEFELLEHLDGSTKRWIRVNQETQCVVPDKKQVFLEKRPSTMLAFPYFSSLEAKSYLKSVYSIQEFSAKRVAGREARVIHLLPKDQYRYQYRFYLDKQRQFLLRSEILSEHGRVLEQVGFTDISFDVAPISVSALLNTDQGWKVRSTELSSLNVSDLPYQLPDELLGFKRFNQFCRSKDKDTKVDHFIFSDGLSTVSMFVKKGGSNIETPPVALSHGAVMFKSMVHEGYVVTAVGEVPERTLSLFLRSIQWTSR